MLKLSMTPKIECKVPPENVLLHTISDTLEKKHVIVGDGFRDGWGGKLEFLLNIINRKDDFSRRRGEFLVNALYNCICHQIRG
jgi:hypothetical protein